jgi:hypothetical protein
MVQGLPFLFTELLELTQYSDGAQEWKAGPATLLAPTSTKLANYQRLLYGLYMSLG